MDINRFKKIIEYSMANRGQMDSKIRDFYASAQMDGDREVLNLIQVARPLFEKKGYLIVEIPFADDEIGAICYKGDSLGYTFFNTSLPKVNVNFALCHEIYHIFYQEKEFKQKVELLNEHYYEYEGEFAANLFAGMLLMPKNSFSMMYYKFKNELKNGEDNISVLAKLMNYFEVPYMAALVRCYELELLDSGKVLEDLIKVDGEKVKSVFEELWLDENILCASKKDDYDRFETLVRVIGKQNIKEGYVNEVTVDKVVQNMRVLYEKIKGE